MRKWHKIEYFHPEGKFMPNGINYQRGWFSKQCRDNMDAFLPVSPEVRGVLILPSQAVETESSQGSHLFTGRYIHDGVAFDIASDTIEINASSAREARKIAARYCESHSINTAVLKIITLRRWHHLFFDKSPKFYLYLST